MCWYAWICCLYVCVVDIFIVNNLYRKFDLCVYNHFGSSKTWEINNIIFLHMLYYWIILRVLLGVYYYSVLETNEDEERWGHLPMNL